MNASLLDLMIYEKTGKASQNLSASGKMLAKAIFGSDNPVKTITGIPPILFTGDGEPLTAWKICGDMSENLCSELVDDVMISATNGKETTDSRYKSTDYIPVDFSDSASYTVSGTLSSMYISAYDENKTYCGRTDGDLLSGTVMTSGSFTRGTPASSNEPKFLRICCRKASENVMLNKGAKALPYKPYAPGVGDLVAEGAHAGEYAVPITINEETQTVYLSEPLRKAIDGSNAADCMSSDGIITRRVGSDGNALVTPTTESFEAPTIATEDGQNTLSVDTALPPSKVSISGNIKR